MSFKSSAIKTTIFATLISLGLAAGCARQETTEIQEEQQASSDAAAEVMEAAVPRATIAPVTVSVTLTPQAEAALKSASEAISVVATYSGDPKASEQAQKLADTSGMIKLGENRQALNGAGSVIFQDDVIDKSKLDYTLGEVQFTINVTSSMTSSQTNLLACPFYWETLANASKQPVQIACKAMSEVQE